MKKGTKIAAGIIASSLLFHSLYSFTIQVPGLETKIQALEHTVEENRKENDELQRTLTQSKVRIQELNDLLWEEQNNNPINETPKVKVTPLSYSKQSNPSKVMTNFQVTWYNDKGTTYSGRQTVDGVTVSVDPRVIPLGTWIKIEFEDGTVLTRRADDTGSAVKGKIIDIYKNSSTKTLNELGRSHNVTVTILDKEV